MNEIVVYKIHDLVNKFKSREKVDIAIKKKLRFDDRQKIKY